MKSIVCRLRKEGYERCIEYLRESYDDLKQDNEYVYTMIDVMFEYGKYSEIVEMMGAVENTKEEEVIMMVIFSLKHLSMEDRLASYLDSVSSRLLTDDTQGYMKLRRFIEEYKERMRVYEGKEMDEVRRKVDRMVEWLKEGGSIMNKVGVCYFSHNYRGIRMVGDASIAEVLLFIPHKYIITYDLAFNCEALKGLMREGVVEKLKSVKHTPLSLFLIYEASKGEKSFYHRYLETLPHSVDGLPVDFTEEEKLMLKGTSIINEINTKIINMKSDYELAKENVDFMKDVGFDEFKRFRNIISSRVFGIKVNEVKTGGMVPFADMINHKFPKMSEWDYEEKEQGFVLRAYDRIDRGLELFDSYGKKCNSRFFISYGFLEENNESNTYTIYMQMNETNIRRFEYKKTKYSYDKGKLKLIACTDFDDESLIKSMRYVLAEKDEEMEVLDKYFEEKKEDDFSLIYNTPPISIEHEMRVLSNVRDVCKSRLSLYDTTMEEDLSILEGMKKGGLEGTGHESSYNKFLCVQYRLGEKKILRHLIEMRDVIVKIVHMSVKEVISLLDHYPYARYRYYIESSIIPLVSQ